VMNVEVSQRECGERGGRKENVRGHGAGILEASLRVIGVDDCEASGGGVEKAFRGEEVQSHNITPSEVPRQKGNSR